MRRGREGEAEADADKRRLWSKWRRRRRNERVLASEYRRSRGGGVNTLAFGGFEGT